MRRGILSWTGVITKIEMNFRTYTVQEEETDVLPPLYAAAIYPAASGQLLAVGYKDERHGAAPGPTG